MDIINIEQNERNKNKILNKKITIKKKKKKKNKEDPKKNLYINEDNLEKRFGGEAIDLDYGEDNSLFPPRMPSDNFFLENENDKDILITE